MIIDQVPTADLKARKLRVAQEGTALRRIFRHPMKIHENDPQSLVRVLVETANTFPESLQSYFCMAEGIVIADISQEPRSQR